MGQLSFLHLSQPLAFFSPLLQEATPVVSAEGVVITLIVVLILLIGAGIGARWLYGDKP